MKRINDIVKKVISFIIIVTFLLFLNYNMAIGAFGEFANDNFKKIVIYVLAFAGVVDALMFTYDFICFVSHKYSDKIMGEFRLSL